MDPLLLDNVPHWPPCLRATRVKNFGFPLKPVYIGTTETGIETRQKISDIPRGAYIDIDVQWLMEGDGSIEEFYSFLHTTAEGAWQVFRIDKSNIPCLIPGWEYYSRYLPTPLWRLDLKQGSNDGDRGLSLEPDGCCAVNFSVRLLNTLDEYRYYSAADSGLDLKLDVPLFNLP